MPRLSQARIDAGWTLSMVGDCSSVEYLLGPDEERRWEPLAEEPFWRRISRVTVPLYWVHIDPGTGMFESIHLGIHGRMVFLSSDCSDYALESAIEYLETRDTRPEEEMPRPSTRPLVEEFLRNQPRARSAQAIAREVGVSLTTARRHLQMLVAENLAYVSSNSPNLSGSPTPRYRWIQAPPIEVEAWYVEPSPLDDTAGWTDAEFEADMLTGGEGDGPF